MGEVLDTKESQVEHKEVSMKRCPKCGKLYDDSWDFCIHCNVKLDKAFSTVEEETAAVQQARMRKCPNCEEEILKVARICKHCGSKLSARGLINSAGNAPAIISFVLGILAVLTGIWGVGFFLAILAIIVGKGGQDSEHPTLAKWGVGLGWVTIVYVILFAVGWAYIVSMLPVSAYPY